MDQVACLICFIAEYETIILRAEYGTDSNFGSTVVAKIAVSEQKIDVMKKLTTA